MRFNSEEEPRIAVDYILNFDNAAIRIKASAFPMTLWALSLWMNC